MSAPVAVGRSALVKRRIGGLVFLLVLALLVGLTVALYQKAFTPVVDVTLKTDRIGNQLSAPADVKLRGLVVGEVRGVSSDGDGATVRLALQPDKVKLIPFNVTAQLLPKTLFGEKYVLLVTPPAPSSEHLQQGDEIPQDRTETALETERVLDDLMPLLESLRPAQLSLTLNALSTALRDRGDKLGNNLASAAAYFRQINPALPTLAQDMQGLADFSNSTADATPALLQVLDNLSASSRSLVEEKASLDAFLSSTTRFAASAQSIVDQNSRRLVALARDSLPSLSLYARYSPEFTCLLKGLATYEPIVNKTFGGLQPGLHITVEATQDNGGFRPGQEPKYRDDRAPYCNGLPRPAVPQGEASFDDGYRTGSTPTANAASFLGPTSGSTMEPAIAAVAAPVLGVPVQDVPDIVTLLFGPLARGNSVGLT
jgi:phospholipid/cholesterol/gamma-HCH transport system substrate-binding protein